jgi:hypothetical protein
MLVMERAMTIWGSIISSMAHERMKLRMRVRLPKDRTNRPRGKLPFGRFRRRFCGIRVLGVISIGAMQIQMVEATRRLRHLQIPTDPATAPDS